MIVTHSVTKWIVCIAMIASSALFAADPLANAEPHGFVPTESTHANWVFSGMVVNESGENYNYFFQIQRDEHDFHATVALFDAQTKKVILQEDSHARIDEPNLYNWSVGRAFLRFNAINDSWVFGLKDQTKLGFNFKVDMLNQPEHNPVTQYFRHGISFVVVQTGQLNGHLHDAEKEQFVTSKNAWFRQIWLTNTKDTPHQLNGLLCRFNDGSGIYSMKVLQSDSLRGAVAGLFDAQGASTAISQFIHIEQQDSSWLIRITSPKMHLVLKDIMKQNEVVAGFVSEKDTHGFCMLSQDAMGESQRQSVVQSPVYLSKLNSTRSP
ncbi:MAG: hypothetical protein Q8R24_03305 [Legionellaceae bacterium]|nr:hypothetical protein [Legionellaceae bacterium]